LRVALEGEDGWRKAVAHQPDAILLDICMPAPDGLCLCRRLKADPRTAEIPVLFLTGRITPRDKLAGFQAGASDYITKPYQAEEVLARLRVHQDMRWRLRALAATVPAGRNTGAAVPAGGQDDFRPIARAPDASPLATDAAPEPAEGSRSDRLLALAIATLRADLAEPPTLPELARRIGTNERTLTELFRHRLGRPVFAWLREERFGRACDLLLGGEQDIGGIAGEVGYASAAAFATAFRERFGMTPSRYRRSAGLGNGAAAGRAAHPPTAART
jgi:DNA-binding response OmpR family regulator